MVTRVNSKWGGGILHIPEILVEVKVLICQQKNPQIYLTQGWTSLIYLLSFIKGGQNDDAHKRCT
jgi:hypothetical protein